MDAATAHGGGREWDRGRKRSGAGDGRKMQRGEERGKEAFPESKNKQTK